MSIYSSTRRMSAKELQIFSIGKLSLLLFIILMLVSIFIEIRVDIEKVEELRKWIR